MDGIFSAHSSPFFSFIINTWQNDWQHEAMWHYFSMSYQIDDGSYNRWFVLLFYALSKRYVTSFYASASCKDLNFIIYYGKIMSHGRELLVHVNLFAMCQQ